MSFFWLTGKIAFQLFLNSAQSEMEHKSAGREFHVVGLRCDVVVGLCSRAQTTMCFPAEYNQLLLVNTVSLAMLPCDQ